MRDIGEKYDVRHENEFIEDLMVAAKEIVDENPGIGYKEWVDELTCQYPTEVVDALGTNRANVDSSLKEIWDGLNRGG